MGLSPQKRADSTRGDPESTADNCVLSTSTDLLNWLPIATNQIGAEGRWLLVQPLDPPPRFYRAALP